MSDCYQREVGLAAGVHRRGGRDDDHGQRRLPGQRGPAAGAADLQETLIAEAIEYRPALRRRHGGLAIGMHDRSRDDLGGGMLAVDLTYRWRRWQADPGGRG